MSCCGTGMANFSCGIASLLRHHPWANTMSYSHVKLRACWLRAPPGELGRTLSHMAKLPWHRGMFSLIHSIRQILSQEATKIFKNIVLCK